MQISSQLPQMPSLTPDRSKAEGVPVEPGTLENAKSAKDLPFTVTEARAPQASSKLMAKVDDMIAGLDKSDAERLERALIRKNADGTRELRFDDQEVQKLVDFADGLSVDQKSQFAKMASTSIHLDRALDLRASSGNIGLGQMMDQLEALDEEMLGRVLEMGARFSTDKILSADSVDAVYTTTDTRELGVRHMMQALVKADDPATLMDQLEEFTDSQQLGLMEAIAITDESGFKLMENLGEYRHQARESVLSFVGDMLDERINGADYNGNSAELQSSRGGATYEGYDNSFTSNVDGSIAQLSDMLSEYKFEEEDLTSLMSSMRGVEPQYQRATLEIAERTLHMYTKDDLRQHGEKIDLSGRDDVLQPLNNMISSDRMVAAVVDAQFSGNRGSIQSLVEIGAALSEAGTEAGEGSASIANSIDGVMDKLIQLEDGVNRRGRFEKTMDDGSTQMMSDDGGIDWRGKEGFSQGDERTAQVMALADMLKDWEPGMEEPASAMTEFLGRAEAIRETDDIRELLGITEQADHIFYDESIPPEAASELVEAMVADVRQEFGKLDITLSQNLQEVALEELEDVRALNDKEHDKAPEDIQARQDADSGKDSSGSDDGDEATAS